MRKILLACLALCLPRLALAQSAVFPETTRAGKLDGAAPSSVTVSIGGTFFTGIALTDGSDDVGHRTNPQFLDYLRLYPNFDYVNPAGIHFGVSGEIRSGALANGGNGSVQGQNRSTNSLYWHSAFAYASSDKLGKIEFGTPNDATGALAAGLGDEWGTGGFFGEYGWISSPNWISGDAYDGYIPHQKITYISPDIAGFTAAISYQPNSTGLTNSSGLTNGGDFGGSHNRYNGAVAYRQNFGPFGVKADVAYTGASGDQGGGAFQNVSIFNAGAVLTFAGFEVEGNVNTGKYAYNSPNGAEPVMGPEPDGEKGTTEWLAGVGYTIGAFAVGAQYYTVGFDAGQIANGVPGTSGRVQGEALSGSYALGPGVNLNFDLAHDTIKGATTGEDHGNIAAVGAYFAW